MTTPTPDRITRFEALVAQFPTSEVPRYSLGQALMDAGRYDEAATTFVACTTLRADFLMAWVLAAQCFVRLERWADARNYAVKGLALAIAQGHSGPRGDAEALLEEIEQAGG